MKQIVMILPRFLIDNKSEGKLSKIRRGIAHQLKARTSTIVLFGHCRHWWTSTTADHHLFEEQGVEVRQSYFQSIGEVDLNPSRDLQGSKWAHSPSRPNPIWAGILMDRWSNMLIAYDTEYAMMHFREKSWRICWNWEIAFSLTGTHYTKCSVGG